VHLAALVTNALTIGWCLALVAITLLVAWRRLAGVLTVPNNDAVLLAACLAVSLLSLLVGRMPLPRRLACINGAGPLGLAAALTFPDSGWPVWLMLWSITAVPMAVAAVTLAGAAATSSGTAVPLAGAFGRLSMLTRSPASRRRADDQPSAVPLAVSNVAVSPAAGAIDGTNPDDVVQELTRGTSAAGNDTLVGRIRVRLEPGARSQRAHVAFCPPFASAPGVTLEASDPSGPQVRVGQVLPQGVRFDLKRRSGSDLNADVEIRFRAVDESRPVSD
jgi:hypothetical protein